MDNQAVKLTEEQWRKKLKYAYDQSEMFEKLYLKYEKLYHEEVKKNKEEK